ncbi:MAG: DUF393 domain-containing protein [Oligoflexia bacterium]|nr:DUF393 domain-containing protein [Oligoflexia bacterium]
MDPDSPSQALPPRIVLFDGTCGFCDATVRWLLDHDVDGRLFYAPLQGSSAQQIRERHPAMPPDLDSLVFVETSPRGRERVYWYSRAVLGISKHLPLPWRLARLGWLVPWFLRDLGYRVFARFRYRIFGRVDACRVPAQIQRSRFLP